MNLAIAEDHYPVMSGEFSGDKFVLYIKIIYLHINIPLNISVPRTKRRRRALSWIPRKEEAGAGRY